MYAEFLSHWQFIFQYTRIIYTRKYNIRDCIQHLQKQSGSSNLKRKNYARDEGLFLCWFWHLSHQVQRRPCGKSAHPTQRVEINGTWTQTGKEKASLHGPFPLHSNSYVPSKIHGEVQPLPKRYLVKKTQMCIMWGCKSPSWSEGGCVWGKHALACAFGGSIRVLLLSSAQDVSSHEKSSTQAGTPWVRMCDPVASPQQTQATHTCLRASWRVRKSTPKAGSDIGHNWSPCWCLMPGTAWE